MRGEIDPPWDTSEFTVRAFSAMPESVWPKDKMRVMFTIVGRQVAVQFWMADLPRNPLEGNVRAIWRQVVMGEVREPIDVTDITKEIT